MAFDDDVAADDDGVDDGGENDDADAGSFLFITLTHHSRHSPGGLA